MTSALDRPVFVTGCGRSGTTLVYELLARHPDVGWFSNYTDRFHGIPQLAILSRLYPLACMNKPGSRGTLKPSEGYRLWDSCSPRSPDEEHRRLTEEDATPDERRRIQRLALAHLRYQGRSRFLHKNTRLAHRLRHLNVLFDDAHVIHVVRDPRAAVSSLLKVAFWPGLHLWWRDGQTPSELVSSGLAPEALAAELWREEVQCLTEDASCLPPNRYLEIRYEQLVADPAGVVATILAFAELRYDQKFLTAVNSFDIRDTSGNYGRYLSVDQIAQVEMTVGSVARKLGYRLASGQ